MTGAVQLPLALPHRAALGAADFLVGECNELAVGWLDRWPAWPGPSLILFGPPACGKTHLTRVWQARSAARLIDAKAAGAADPQALLGAARAAVIDDADGWAGAADAERTLLHLYNLLLERSGHLLLTAAEPATRWPIGLSDLASRLRGAPSVAVTGPDDGLLAGVLVKLFADRQLRVGQDLVAYLVPRMERSFAAARAVVERLDRLSLSGRRPITVPLARMVLGEAAEPAGPVERGTAS